MEHATEALAYLAEDRGTFNKLQRKALGEIIANCRKSNVDEAPNKKGRVMQSHQYL